MDTNKRTLKLYWAQVRKYKPSFFLALICIPSSALLIYTLLPFYLSQSIGGLTTNNPDLVTENLVFSGIIGVIGLILNYVGFMALTYHEASIRSSLSSDTFDQIIRKDVRFFTNTKIGALTSRFIDFIRSEVDLQDLLIIRTLGFILSVISALVILSIKSWILGAILLALIIVLLIQVKWSIKKRAPWRHQRKELTSEINGMVADSLTNSLVVKTFANEDNEILSLKQKNNLFKEIFIKDVGFVMKEGSARVALMVILQIASIAIGSYMLFNDRVDIATIIFMLTYFQRIAGYLFELGSMVDGFDRALLEAAPMSDMLATHKLISDKTNAKTIKEINPVISFKNVSYRYTDNNDNVLNSINLHINAGEKIGLVGNSGAGKTTLTSLLLRFDDVSNGSITIDSHDIRDITQKSLRKNIAFVPQDPMLFHRTLRENIRYSKPEATDKEIWKAAEQANATEFIKKIPQGLDAVVGERGIKLSGGQRQRIAIARAILKDAPILVLDEATSALDSENERLIQNALAKLMKGRTSVVIAHRLSTIAKMDRIIVLENGKIMEEGTHRELLSKSGIYAKLWSHQSGGFIEE